MLFLVKILLLPPFSIYTHYLITPDSFESFASILSRSQKLFAHTDRQLASVLKLSK